LSGSGAGISYEVAETPLDQAQAEVVATPHQFFVSNQDDRFAWERARYFLENYSGSEAGSNTVVSKVVGDRWGLQNGPKAGEYSYEVWKDPMSNGYRYVVRCAPRSSDGGREHQAKLNASNLSRFISQGKLELALLEGRR
jgi:hypothetical protein